MKTTHVNIPFIIHDNVRLQLYNFSGFALHLSFIDKCAFTTFQVLRYVYHLLINVLLQHFRFAVHLSVLIDVLLQLSGFALHLSLIDKCAFTTFPVLRLG